MEKSKNTVRVNYRIPEDLKERLEKASQETGKTMTHIILEGLRLVLFQLGK